MITNTTRRFWYVLLTSIAFLIRNSYFKKGILGIALLLGIGFILPQKMMIPVKDATIKSWAEDSFWAYPWGSSITHKGIDIFAKRGTDVISATHGIVVYTFNKGKGGKSVMVLGPKWRFHYYAHLDSYTAYAFQPLRPGTYLGAVGDTGNAKGKPPHLHYAITSPFPYPGLYDGEAVQGWRKMFHLNPDEWLRKK